MGGSRGLAAAASALLQLSEAELRALAEIHFVGSEEVQELLAEMPSLIRKLATTTVIEEERHPERIRGSIRWGETFKQSIGHWFSVSLRDRPRSSRAPNPGATSSLSMSSTSSQMPAGVLAGALKARASGDGFPSEPSERTSSAVDDLSRRSSESHPCGQPPLARVATGRYRGRYRFALDAYKLHTRLIRQLDSEAIQRAVNELALVVADDPTLFEEIRVLFDILTPLGAGVGT